MTNGPRTGKMNKPVKNNRPGSAVVRKIVSKTGASITFALLLFLVCAVVGSVVLVAGTSAAGRMSQIAEYDQRYYSVTSAAELLADKFGNYQVKIVQEQTDTSTEEAEYVKDANGVVISRTMVPKGTTTSYSASISGSDEAASRLITSGQSILRDAAIDLVFDPGAGLDYTTAAAYAKGFPAMTAEKTKTLNITHDVGTSGLTAADLAVDAVMTLNPNGDITIKISNVTDVAAEKYELVMILKASVIPNTSSSTSVSGQGTDTVVTTSKTIKTTTITWTVKDVY
jgi:hypothetical protein